MHSKPWDRGKYAAVDLELTGAHQFSGRSGICEIGGVQVNHGDVDPENVFVALVNPLERSSRQALSVHGLPNFVLQQAKPLHLWAKPLKEFVGDRILIAHGARAEFEGLRRGIQNFQMPVIFDTHLLAKALLTEKGGYSLENLLQTHDDVREKVDRDFNPRLGRSQRLHSAYFDALAAGHLFVNLVRKHLSLATIDDIADICAYRREMKHQQFQSATL